MCSQTPHAGSHQHECGASGGAQGWWLEKDRRSQSMYLVSLLRDEYILPKPGAHGVSTWNHQRTSIWPSQQVGDPGLGQGAGQQRVCAGTRGICEHACACDPGDCLPRVPCTRDLLPVPCPEEEGLGCLPWGCASPLWGAAEAEHPLCQRLWPAVPVSSVCVCLTRARAQLHFCKWEKVTLIPEPGTTLCRRGPGLEQLEEAAAYNAPLI